MTQTTINFQGLENLKNTFQNISVENEELRTYTVEYKYAECSNIFKKEIFAENDFDAIYEAQKYINAENAKVAGKPKAGNYINVCFLVNDSRKTVSVLKF